MRIMWDKKRILYAHYPQIVENQLEHKVENEMDNKNRKGCVYRDYTEPRSLNPKP